MTTRQEELRAKHGTPREFAAASNRAADQLVITTAECEAGIKKYNEEWQDAGIELPNVPELKNALPVVLYFGNEADRQEFLEMVKAVKPGMVARAL